MPTCAYACHDTGGKRVRSAGISAGKTVGGRKCEDRPGCRCAAAVGIGDPGNAARRIFGGQRGFAQFFRRRVDPVVQIQIDAIAAEQRIGRCQPAIGIFRCQPRHFNRAFRKQFQPFGRKIAGADRCRSPPDEHAQADLFAFRSLDVLQGTEAHADTFGSGCAGDGIGLVRAHLAGQLDQVLAAGQRGVGPDHGISRKCAVIRAR